MTLNSAHDLTSHTTDIDDPIPAANRTTFTGPPAERVASIVEMGFTPNQAKKALKETVHTLPILYCQRNLRVSHARRAITWNEP